MACSEFHTAHLPLKLVLEFLTFLLLGYLYETAASLLEILATFFLEGLYAQFAAIFDDFDIAISYWEVLALGLIWLLVLITVELVRGKSADATVVLRLLHHHEVVLSNLVLLVLLDHQA